MIPNKIIIENFASHKNSELTFDFKTALIIGAIDNNNEKSNGSGKSTVFEAITWALFGECRLKPAASVIKRGENQCSVTLYFSVNGEQYKIHRVRKSKSNSEQVYFYYVDLFGEEAIIHGDTNSEIQDKIISVIKFNYKSFTNTCYFMQNSISEFVDATPSNKQALLTEILALDRWNDYEEAANAKYDEVNKLAISEKAQLEKIKAETESYGAKKIELEKTEEKILSLTSEIDELEKEINQTNSLRLLKSQEVFSIDKLETLKRTQQDISSSIRNQEQYIKKYKEDIVNSLQKVEQLKNQIVKIEEEIRDLSLVEGWNGTKTTDEMRMKLVHKQAEIKQLKELIDRLESSMECNSCGRAFDSEKERQEHIAELKTKCKSKEDAYAKAEPVYYTATSLEKGKQEALVKMQTLTLKATNIKAEKQREQNNVEKFEREVSILEEKVTADKTKYLEIESEISKMPDKSISKKEIDLMVESLKKSDLKLKESKTLLNNLLIKKGGLINTLNLQKELIEKIPELERVYLEHKEMSGHYSYLQKAFSKNGIRNMLFQNTLNDLSNKVASLLELFDFKDVTVKFITQKENSKGNKKDTLEIVILDNATGEEVGFKNLSGGQQFRIAFSIRMALSQIQASKIGSKVGFVQLDEVSSSLDKYGLECFINIINKLSNNMKIMVITHDHSLMSEFANIVKVEKKNDTSTITRI